MSVPATATVPSEDVATPSLSSRLLTRRTLLSLAATLVIVGFAATKIDWRALWEHVRHADVRLYLLAIVAYYASFVVRAVRWQLLLRNAGEECHLVPLWETLIVSFFVNCVVPAKMGDVYRAFLLRTHQRVGAMKAFGTIIAERLLDLFVLMGLLVIAGAATFHNRVPSQLVPYFIAGIALCVVGIVAVAVMVTGRGRRILRLFPDPVVRRYESFRQGTVGAFGRWPAVLSLSVLVWALESTRLAFVVFALGDQGHVGVANFLLVALIAALLTTVPFTPGGIGLVEGGMAAVLTIVTTVDRNSAVAIALLDRSISYGTLIVVGCVVFALTHARTHPSTAATAAG